MKPVQAPKTFSELMKDLPADSFTKVIQVGAANALANGKYHHWDKLRHLEPPEGITVEEWWFGIKFARLQGRKFIPLADKDIRSFSFLMADPVQEMLHQIDQKAAGRIELSEEVTNPETRDRYIMNSLIEEAITSSQMEGASTTRAIASDMIRSGRAPKDRSERMIVNNYVAIKQIRTLVQDELTPDKVLELHRILTEDTLDNPDAAGRLQLPEEQRVSVVDNVSHRILFEPPPAEELPFRLQMMCDFANGKSATQTFIHPIVRSIILHFWLAHDHPFEDGNGRTARALFYWSMLSNGYWLFEYVSISTILKRAFSQYGMSYLYTESDENDLTYFIIFQLEVILKAIAKLEKYMEGKIAQIRVVESQLKSGTNFNHRQIALLSHALRHPNAEYTIKSHQRSHNVAYATASSDLMALAKAGLLDRRRSGQKTHIFTAPGNMQLRLERFSQGS